MKTKKTLAAVLMSAILITLLMVNISIAQEHRERGESEDKGSSSPIISIENSYKGVILGLEANFSYNAKTKTITGTIKNVTSKTITFIQNEPHLKLGKRTVGELGPQKLGNLKPGETTKSTLYIKDEPELKNVKFDGYVIHLELGDTGYSGEGRESREGHGEHGVREGHGEHGGEKGEHREEGKEGGVKYKKSQSVDETKRGVRLKLRYDASSSAFIGTMENVSNENVRRARVEVHLSNGVELGPTKPVDIPPGKTVSVKLDAKGQSFEKWETHAEVGSSEGGHGKGGESDIK